MQQQAALEVSSSLIQQQAVETQKRKLQQRKPGRPRKPLLKLSNPMSNDIGDDQQQMVDGNENWFKTPFIHEILAAVAKHRSSTLAVRELKLRHPKGEFEMEPRYCNSLLSCLITTHCNS